MEQTSDRTGEVTDAIVYRAVAGDVEALAAIIARYQGDMVRVCVIICNGDGEAAADAVQSAWPIVWRRLRSLRDHTRLRGWLVSIAANQARQLQRGERRRRVRELRMAPFDRAEFAGPPDPGLADLRTALRGLTADERSLLALRYVAGFDSMQIGAALGISASGARSRLERLL